MTIALRLPVKAACTLSMAGILCVSQFFSAYSWAESDGKTLKGGVMHTDRVQDLPTVNEDEIKNLDPGTTLDMVISTGLTTGISAEGDEFFAKLSRDYVVDGKIVLPKGTLVHGQVNTMQDKKWAGRNAWVATKFDYLITPDGREIPIEGQFNNRDSKVKAAAKVVGRASGFTAAGGVVGAMLVLRYGGLAAVAASNGYALAGGAAIGGAAGLTAAMVSKGKSLMIEPGSDIKVKLAEPLSLPTMNMPDAKAEDFSLPGLDVKVIGYRFDKDPFGEANEITLTLAIDNKTENSFSSFDVGLQDEHGNTFYPSPFGDTGMWFKKLSPNTKMNTNITFNVDNTKRVHHLVFFKQYTRQPLAKFALTDDMQMSGKAQKNSQKALAKKAQAKSDDW